MLAPCRRLAPLLTLATLWLAGCTSSRLAYDHRVMRTELLALYDQQLMDNLVRAYTGWPVLQIRYGVIDGTSKTNVELGGTYADEDQQVINFGGDAETGSFTDEDGTNVTGAVAIESTMAISGTPVLDDPELQERYRDFAIQYLQCTDAPPPKTALLVGTGNHRDRRHYWIPRTMVDDRGREVYMAPRLAELADRVMVDGGGSATSSLNGSARVVVKIKTNPAESGNVWECDITLTPAVNRAGEFEWELSNRDVAVEKAYAVAPEDARDERRDQPASKPIRTIDSTTVRAIVVPKDGDPGTHRLSVLSTDLEKAVRIDASASSAGDWLRQRLTRRVQTLMFEKSTGEGVDLNAMGRLLRDRLQQD